MLLQIVRLPLFCLSGFVAEFQASSALPGCVRMVDLLVMLRCFVEVYWADGRVLGRFKWGWQQGRSQDKWLLGSVLKVLSANL